MAQTYFYEDGAENLARKPDEITGAPAKWHSHQNQALYDTDAFDYKFGFSAYVPATLSKPAYAAYKLECNNQFVICDIGPSSNTQYTSNPGFGLRFIATDYSSKPFIASSVISSSEPKRYTITYHFPLDGSCVVYPYATGDHYAFIFGRFEVSKEARAAEGHIDPVTE